MATVQQGTVTDLQAAIDAANAWYAANGGMAIFEDIDDVPIQIDVCAGCYAVMGNFYDEDSYFSIIDVDNFTEWLLRNPGVPDDYTCLEQVDIGGPESEPGNPDAWGTLVPDGVVSILDLDQMVGYLLRDPQEYENLGECP